VSTRTIRELQRALEGAIPGLAGSAALDAPPLEVTATPIDPPRTRACTVVEGARLDVRFPEGEPDVAFTGFLDGTQRSRVVAYVAGAPIVVADVAAVIRVRSMRRLTTWRAGPLATSRIYVPRRLMPAPVLSAIGSLGLEVADVLGADASSGDLPHPHDLLRRAVHRVQEDRDALERRLAEAWTGSEATPLYVDGGLPSGERAAMSPWLVGVVKSHHTLYSGAEGMAVVLSLPEGARSSVFLVSRTWGPPVLSWYLRLRRAAPQDPFRGLVRVEIAPLGGEPGDGALSARADRVSRWVLAERYPLALPDGRWDRLAYGVRDCEEFLRAVAG
jgi:hypothetical protein